MSRAWCGRSLLNSSRKSSNLLCCCRLFRPAGRVVSVLSVRCKALKGRKSKSLTGRFQSFTQEQIARGVIGDGQRVAVFLVAQPEFAFVIGAPQLVGFLSQRQGRALRMVAFAPAALHQTMAIEHGVDGAAGRNLN